MSANPIKNRIVLLSLTLLITLFAAGCVYNCNDDATVKSYTSETLAGVNKIIDDGMAQYSVPGAMVAVWDSGYETLLITKGKSDVASGRAVKMTDRFRIASNTKMFTAVSLLILADRKKLALDDKVSKYLPDIPYADQVTIRQLANHTAGYFNYTNDPAFEAATAANPLKKWTPQEIIDLIKNKPLDFTPGSQHSYSNTGYIIMGMLVEKLSSVKWETFVTENIIKPLALNETSCPVDSNIPGEHMNGYNIEGSKAVEIIVDPSMGWSAGAMISTVSDLRKWLDSVRTGSLLSPEMDAEHKKWVYTEAGSTASGYGFGLSLVASQFVGHTGGIEGYNSFCFISLDGRKCVIVIHNTEAGAIEVATSLFRYLGLRNH